MKLLVVALESEFDADLLPEDWAIVYTGVGKINATLMLAQAIGVFEPSMVINYGTAGAVSDVSGLIEIKGFIQRDMDTEPLADRGMTPGDKQNVFACATTNSKYVCGTGDSFVTDEDPWLKETGIDCVDMEGFALAKVCDYVGVPFRSWKFISDGADDDAAEAWKENVSNGQMTFLQEVVMKEFGATMRKLH